MANEKRLIDANAYCKELYLERDYPGRSEEFISAMEVAIADLGDMPTVDAVEVVHGRWNMDEEMYAWNCSVCRSISLNGRRYSYCHNCGAKMDGDGNG